MARYDGEFGQFPAWTSRPAGMDPNFRDGYQGMRMADGPGQAAYGWHRYVRREDLGGMGGFGGIYEGPSRVRHGGYDADVRMGGIRDPFRDRRFLRGFNANTPEYEDEERGGRGEGGALRRREPDWYPSRDFRREYTNRGMPPAGFSEGWARGPMRGSR